MICNKSILLKDLCNVLTCPLCLGYYIDATTLVDCMHSFCKSCIMKHFENNRMNCPTCNTVCKKKETSTYYRQDMQLQTLVYKIVPGLYAKEIQRREDFYRTAGVRASSSCSDDSVIGDNMQEHEEWVHTIGDENQFFGPDDSISLSLEYYQQHLDSTSVESAFDRRKSDNTNGSDDSANISVKDDSDTKVSDDKVQNDQDESKMKDEKVRDRRYLQCPAAVSMTHLQKFIRMKYALSSEHKVDIIHDGEVLPCNFTLMDVAYTFKWKRVKPMRFFYRIFTPMKIKPIKIISTSTSGQKQLQIVQVSTTSSSSQENKAPENVKKQSNTEASNTTNIEAEENVKEKERLMAELQLQSKAKMAENAETTERNPRYGKTYERNHEMNNVLAGEKRKREIEDGERDDALGEKRKKIENETDAKTEKRKRDDEETNCIFDYEETDKEELKRFAENRDREWQMIKHSEDEHRAYKKRKKNKHSRGDFQHKKRKMHAEITSELSNKQESIKLKVKLTPHNGHKHKHHKNQIEDTVEMSSKEKLRQMRQVRHKMIGNEEKVQKAIGENPKEESKGEFTITLAKASTETQTRNSEAVEMKSSETQTKTSETQTMPKDEPKEKPETIFCGKTLRSDFTIKTAASKELCNRQVIVQTEKLEFVERHIQKNYPKISYPKLEKPKVESADKKVAQSTKSLQQQISRLQQQCSLRPKDVKVEPAKQEKKVGFSNDKPHILNAQYPPGFTVSKVEAGVKKKLEIEDPNQDKRPSLEITLINPAPTTVASTVTAPKQSPTTTKRPLPATIPLNKIKSMKSITTLSGISIIPKVSEKCDNIGALDLSKPHKSTETKVELNKNGLNPNGNGLKPITTSQVDKGPLSNLQMLSKVAIEHANINKSLNVQNKPRQQMPSLQNIKMPNTTVQGQTKPSNLAKMPKLNEINKSQFRMVNSPRTMRPNQNQSIRNIPNPSLLVRQQNQNRMNSLNMATSSNETKEIKNTVSTAIETAKKDEQKAGDKCDMTVLKT